MMRKLHKLHDERGMTPILVTMILMIVISLLVVAFAQTIRREQRQALDNQLSSQAYYAAESGINVARQYVTKTYLTSTGSKFGQPIDTKSTCGITGPTDPYASLATPTTIDPSTGSSYTCLLISAALPDLRYDLSPSKGSQVFPIDGGATVLGKITFSWSPATTIAKPQLDCPGAAGGNLPVVTNWGTGNNCGYAMLRVDLVPISASMTRQSLVGSTMTAYIMPYSAALGSDIAYNAGNNNIATGTANQGVLTSAGCTATKCTATIDLPSASTTTQYYARVSTLYLGTTVTVTATDNTAGNNPVLLNNAQLLIDSTGKAQDVLRRIQVRVGLAGGRTHADYAIQSNQSLCKTFAANGNPYQNLPDPAANCGSGD